MSAVVARYVRLILTRCSRDDWEAPMLSTRARHLFEVLSNYADERGQAFPAVDTLAERMGITAANVRRARAELVAAGVIAVDEGGGRHQTNTYRFPVTSPLEVVHTPRATARVSKSTSRAPARGNPRATARPRSIEEPRVTSTDAVPRAAPSPGFGGYPSGRRYGPRGPQPRRAAE